MVAILGMTFVNRASDKIKKGEHFWRPPLSTITIYPIFFRYANKVYFLKLVVMYFSLINWLFSSQFPNPFE